MVRYLILDLDGTVADLSHRLHFIQGDKKDYDSFYAAVGDDAPIDSVIHVVRSLVDLGRDTSLGGLSLHCLYGSSSAVYSCYSGVASEAGSSL